MKPEVNNNLISKDKLKDVLITKVAMKTLQPVSVIEKIISHTFKSAAEAIKTEREVEISGFGVFKTNDYRAKQLIEKRKAQINKIKKKMTEREYSESAQLNYQKTIEKLEYDIECLNRKMGNTTKDEN